MTNSGASSPATCFPPMTWRILKVAWPRFHTQKCDHLLVSKLFTGVVKQQTHEVNIDIFLIYRDSTFQAFNSFKSIRFVRKLLVIHSTFILQADLEVKTHMETFMLQINFMEIDTSCLAWNDLVHWRLLGFHSWNHEGKYIILSRDALLYLVESNTGIAGYPLL